MKTLRNEPICQDVYTFVQQYMRDHHFPPSQREIASACFVSKATVVRCLDRLEAKGLLVREPGRARGIGLLPDEPAP
ncbi:MAG: MarR family transcriptional regulator [Anaerolineae bacterium]|nr:MarR family transcriptional regulator [Anaerolineae bacterium]